MPPGLLPKTSAHPPRFYAAWIAEAVFDSQRELARLAYRVDDRHLDPRRP